METATIDRGTNTLPLAVTYVPNGITQSSGRGGFEKNVFADGCAWRLRQYCRY